MKTNVPKIRWHNNDLDQTLKTLGNAIITPHTTYHQLHLWAEIQDDHIILYYPDELPQDLLDAIADENIPKMPQKPSPP